jgi:uncharacterized membrane protein
MLGIVLSLMAAVGFGSTAVFARLGLEHMRATTGTLVSLIVSSVIALAIALSLHGSEIFGLGGTVLAWLALAGVLSFPLGRLLNYTGISLAGVSRASPIVGTAPLFATVLALSIGGESMNMPILLGTVSIIAGVSLILSQQ